MNLIMTAPGQHAARASGIYLCRLTVPCAQQSTQRRPEEQERPALEHLPDLDALEG